MAYTPPSPTDTVVSPSSPKVPAVDSVFNNPRIPAANLIEYISSRSANSSSVYIYDLSEQVGFGSLTRNWAGSDPAAAPVVSLQTRPGAALSLVGRLSEGTSRVGTMLTAYSSISGLAMMATALRHLPSATLSCRLVIQVPNLTLGENMAFSASLAPLATALPIFPESVAILLSATPQEAADFAQLAYQVSSHHVVHIFDHLSSSREIGHSLVPTPPTHDNETNLKILLERAGYTPFKYVGDPDAKTVIVVMNGPFARVANGLSETSPGLGILSVLVASPWDEAAFLATLPNSTTTVHVFDDVPNTFMVGHLYSQVLGTAAASRGSVRVHGHRLTASDLDCFLSKQVSIEDFFANYGLNHLQPPKSSNKKLLLLGSPTTPLSPLPLMLLDFFSSHKSISARLMTEYDVVTRSSSPIQASRVTLAATKEHASVPPLAFDLPTNPSVGETDFLGVLDCKLLKTHDVIQSCKSGCAVLCVTSWSPQETLANIHKMNLDLIIDRNIRVFLIDSAAIADKYANIDSPLHNVVQNFVVQLAFLRLYLGGAADETLILKLALGAFGDNQGVELSKISAKTWASLDELDLTSLPQAAHEEHSTATLQSFQSSSVAEETEETHDLTPQARLGSWHDAARHSLFPSVFAPRRETDVEGFAQNPALRPEVPDRTYLITCTVNRRLTPLEYDRNVFHLEFDIRGTGLKYAIGEALGIHGWNDSQEILEFCSWYGVDPNRLITIPVAAGENVMHTRTVFQSLQQQIDIFGRPPKSFYTDLAAFALSSVDKHALLFVGSPEGSATFKKLSEKDTVTFADVLRLYPSAKPGIEILCQLVGDIKPRHYSIASAQSVVGDRVDLLVVTVDWAIPNGTMRYGQCTRYLASLHVGQKVTVSIKPSVMKLPSDNQQPLIMAGLGTGAAPFRAFLQHRALLVQQGEDVGPVYYYFGSRHQSQEYLYGEEIESFILDGVITRAGLAFSRDGPRKVYIQHKMLEDSQALVRMLHDENGVFYLCGPTWPVPDVFEALVNALTKYQGHDITSAGAYLENLKEEERYVLEVY